MTDAECHTFTNPQPGGVFVGINVRGHDWLDRAIKFCQRSDGTHAKFIRGSGKIIENFWPHVHERDWKPGERDTTEIYRIAGSTPEDWAAMELWFDRELENPAPYSIWDLIRYAVNLPPMPGRQSFCSQWVLRGIRENLSPCKQPLVRLEYQDFGTPSQLRISPLMILKA